MEDLIKETGCKPSCVRNEYAMKLLYHETLKEITGFTGIDGKRVAVVRLSYGGATYREKKEYLAYDEKGL